jgi:hypothetical protein
MDAAYAVRLLVSSSLSSGRVLGDTGLTKYSHINSVDKSTNTGDYLISARHTSSLYSINATDQSIIW